MTDRELELRLADALERTAPDDLEAILSRCGVQNGSAIEMKELKRSGGPVDVDVIEIKPRKRARRWCCWGPAGADWHISGAMPWPLWYRWTSTPASN